MGLIRKLGRKVIDLASGGSPKPSSVPYQPSTAAAPAPVERPVEPTSPRGDQNPIEYIEGLVAEHSVVLFMKGTLSGPQCGFSATAAGIMAGYDVVPHAVNVLIDPEVREAVKEFSGWPTIPQIYIGGEFVGGSDILTQLHGEGELESLVTAAVGG